MHTGILENDSPLFHLYGPPIPELELEWDYEYTLLGEDLAYSVEKDVEFVLPENDNMGELSPFRNSVSQSSWDNEVPNILLGPSDFRDDAVKMEFDQYNHVQKHLSCGTISERDQIYNPSV